MFDCKYCKGILTFAGGILFGTAGIKILSGTDAKKAYVHTVAAGLRAKDCIMDTVGKVQENAGDVMAEAKAVNNRRAEEQAKKKLECTCGKEEE